jgi:precorrin-2 dehydrogenase/sirohydrochlorin ferrochelatase
MGRNSKSAQTNPAEARDEGQPPLLPVFLKVARRRCLVVGAGPAALKKVKALLNCGAAVQVVASQAAEPIQAFARAGALELALREYVPRDMDDAFLVIAATDKREINEAIFQEANRRRILVNTVDDPPRCDLYFSSVVRRGPLQVAISTGGQSPAFAARLKKELDASLPRDLGAWLKGLGKARRAILQEHPAGKARTQALKSLANRPLGDPESAWPEQHERPANILQPKRAQRSRPAARRKPAQ